MSKSSIKIIDKFKRAEKRHEILSDFIVKHQYVLYVYDDDEEDVIFDDLISCLDRIPSKFNIIEDYEYASNCYILQLLSYYIDKDKEHKDVGNYKLKFG